MTQTHYVCEQCSRVYVTDKPQDPEREDGHGVCHHCVEAQVRELVARGWTLLDARTRVRRYA